MERGLKRIFDQMTARQANDGDKPWHIPVRDSQAVFRDMIKMTHKPRATAAECYAFLTKCKSTWAAAWPDIWGDAAEQKRHVDFLTSIVALAKRGLVATSSAEVVALDKERCAIEIVGAPTRILTKTNRLLEQLFKARAWELCKEAPVVPAE